MVDDGDASLAQDIPRRDARTGRAKKKLAPVQDARDNAVPYRDVQQVIHRFAHALQRLIPGIGAGLRRNTGSLYLPPEAPCLRLTAASGLRKTACPLPEKGAGETTRIAVASAR